MEKYDFVILWKMTGGGKQLWLLQIKINQKSFRGAPESGALIEGEIERKQKKPIQ